MGSPLTATASAQNLSDRLHWAALPSIPDRIGFASPFSGVSNGALILGGGANFPGKLPWEGGTKVWYDSVFILEPGADHWIDGFKLPRPLAYGISLTLDEGMLCIGGADSARHYADVFVLKWDHQQLRSLPFPALPGPCAFAGGARAGDTVYLLGGIDTPDATHALNTFWSLDLKRLDGGWKALSPCPGEPRILPVCGAIGEKFYVFSGARLFAGPDGKATREYLRDAWCYSPGRGWNQLADLPHAAVAAANPAAAVQDILFVNSGDDGRYFGQDLREKHPGFARDVLAYNAAENRWIAAGTSSAPFCTTPMVPWDHGFVVPGGEIRPGIRTTQVWMLRIDPQH